MTSVFLKVGTVLVHSDFYNRLPYTVWLTEINISHNSKGWEVQDENTSGSGVSWFIEAVLLLCPHMVEGLRELSRVPFTKSLTPLMRAPLS